MQTFYRGLSNSTRETMDAAAGGAFLSLTITLSTALMEKMASNQGWSEERMQTRKRGGGMHQLKEIDMLAAKMDLLMKRLDERAVEKKEVMDVNDSGMTYVECGETGHTSTNWPELTNDMNYISSSSSTTNTTILSKTKAGTSNSGLTTQVTTQVTTKVIVPTIIPINHL